LDDGQSPLFAAAESGHVALITLLINAGANINARVIDPSPIDPSCSGLTPLGISSKYGH
jgi:ankyrin repeat protein